MKIITAKKNLEPFPLAIVVSRFNEEITSALFQGANKRLEELNFPMQMVSAVFVPGAIEIPLAAEYLAKTKKYEAIICLGAVIRGETSHYDYVCQQVSYGCQKVALENAIPVAFGVLTTDNEEQALARAGGSDGNKGRDAVDVAIEMISILKQIRD